MREYGTMDQTIMSLIIPNCLKNPMAIILMYTVLNFDMPIGQSPNDHALNILVSSFSVEAMVKDLQFQQQKDNEGITGNYGAERVKTPASTLCIQTVKTNKQTKIDLRSLNNIL